MNLNDCRLRRLRPFLRETPVVVPANSPRMGIPGITADQLARSQASPVAYAGGNRVRSAGVDEAQVFGEFGIGTP